MLVAIVATLASFVLLMFIPGSAVNHQGTYATQLLIAIFAVVVLSSRAPWLAALFVALQATTIAALYAVTLTHDSVLLLSLAAAAALALVGYTLAPGLMLHARSAVPTEPSS